jgi:hypothetical protein
LPLDVAVEPARIVLQLSSPLDNLLGFERAPRTDDERKQAAAVLDRLRKPDLFQADPAAGCSLKSVSLSSTALKLGNPDPAEEEAGHADIDGTFELACRDEAHLAGGIEQLEARPAAGIRLSAQAEVSFSVGSNRLQRQAEVAGAVCGRVKLPLRRICRTSSGKANGRARLPQMWRSTW